MNNLINTKWVAEKWTKQMRIKWIDKMMSAGFRNLIAPSDDNCYAYVVGEKTVGGRCKDSYEHSDCMPMKFEDAFPELARDNFDEEFDSMFAQNNKCMTETDPNGINQHEAGAKLDSGKPMAGRLLAMFGNALYAVSEVGTFGANKYTEGGWQHVQDGFKRYDDAGMRHFLKRGMGEEVDPDSNLPHLAHEAWNALAKLELYLRDKAK